MMLHELKPNIIDTDQNADYIRSIVPCVRLDPSIDINNSATADTSIYEIIFAGFADTQLGINDQRIALTN